MLKDQFIFGIYNKEIQDHLLGEIKEIDNSVKSLYEARKIESKLAPRKLLGIVTPTAMSVEAINKDGFIEISKSQMCDYCGCSHRKGQAEIAQHLEKIVIDVMDGKNHFKNCVESPVIVDLSLSQSMTQEGQMTASK